MPRRAKIQYRNAQRQTDLGLGDVLIHTLEQTTGIELVKAPEHSIFLVESPVVSTEIWEGVRQEACEWKAGAVAFLPAGSDLKSVNVSNAYDETIIRLPDHILRDVAVGDEFAGELRFTAVPQNRVIGVASAAKTLANMPGAHPKVVETISAALAAAVIHHCMPYAGKARMERTRTLSHLRKSKVLEFIHANFARPIALGEMADVAALSRFHFSRSFKAATGTSPGRYITLCRINMAKKMLLQSDLSIVAVALACGFSSQSHFCTMFKQAMGVSPTEFRLRA